MRVAFAAPGCARAGSIIVRSFLRNKFKTTAVTSSCLCKNLEGAVFPFQVEALEDGVDDPVQAFDIHKADHGPGAPPNFDEAAFDDVGGAQLSPQLSREAEERQQLRQIAFQLSHHRAIV